MSPNILKIQFSKTFFFSLIEQKNRFDASMVFMVFKNLWKKNNFKALPISQKIISKIGFHGINRFSAVFIINNLNVWRYSSGTMDTKS
jgi:hypothetical protein